MKQSTTNGKSYYGTSSIVVFVLNSDFRDTKPEELNSYILPKQFPSDFGWMRRLIKLTMLYFTWLHSVLGQNHFPLYPCKGKKFLKSKERKQTKLDCSGIT